MAPISSAFGVYQKKRQMRQRRTKRNKPQLRKAQSAEVAHPQKNEDSDTDQDTVIIDSGEASSRYTRAAKKLRKDEVAGGKYKKGGNYHLQDWDTVSELGSKPEDEVLRVPVSVNKQKSKSNAEPSRLLLGRQAAPSVSDRKLPKKLPPMRTDRPSSSHVDEMEATSDNGEAEMESEEEDSDDDVAGPSKKNGSRDTYLDCEHLFQWLIHPCKQTTFFDTAWEKKPTIVRRRNSPKYYKDLVSTPLIDTAFGRNCVAYGRDIDITHYSNGKRKTLNPAGRATRKEVWDFYNKGCTIRLLRPHVYFPTLGMLLATLQEYFCSYVGANIYLTPPDSQGFAPHYDDIEAFVLQIEGRKRWKFYKPRKGEELPRESSKDFHPDELEENPLLDMTLHEGELLYFPRGWIHEAHSVPGYNSLHITVSCYQHQAWIDLFEKMTSGALQMAAEDLDFRRGLPLGYLHSLGVAHCDLNTPARNSFLTDFTYLKKKFLSYLGVDAAVDQIGRQFMHDALPPVLGTDELEQSVFGEKLTATSDGKLVIGRKLNKDMKIKLIRSSVLRLVSEDVESNKVNLYHCGKNSVIYHETEEHVLTLDCEEALMVEYLQHVYPGYIQIRSLPTDEVPVHLKVSLATLLFNNGLLLIAK